VNEGSVVRSQYLWGFDHLSGFAEFIYEKEGLHCHIWLLYMLRGEFLRDLLIAFVMFWKSLGDIGWFSG
jgi:hypothetical protein